MMAFNATPGCAFHSTGYVTVPGTVLTLMMSHVHLVCRDPTFRPCASQEILHNKCLSTCAV